MKRVRVGDVLEFQRRRVEISPDKEYTMIGIFSFGKGIFHRDPQLGIELGDYTFSSVLPGDLVLSNIQAWEGAIGFATEVDLGTIGTHRFLSYTAREPDILDTNWARYFFLSPVGFPLIESAAPGSVTRNRTLARERFEAIEIPLPHIDDQRRVSSHLDRVFSITQCLENRIRTRNKIPARALLPSLVDAAIERSTPRQVAVGELYSVVSDVVHPGDSYDDAECFVGLQHIESHTGRRIGSLPLGDETGRKFRFRPGDVTFGYLAPYLNKVWVADRVGLCSVDQYVLRPSEDVDANLLAYVLRSASTLAQSEELTHNLVLPRLRSKLLASILVADPRSLGEMTRNRLDKVSKRVLGLSDLEKQRADLCSSIVPSALNQAFAGLE